MTDNCSIRSVEVRGLFGRYSYTLGTPLAPLDEHVAILYGDNGCGKTTILKCLFHIMGSSPRSGHRTFLADTKFEAIEINLSNQATIAVTRPRHEISGPFKLSIRGKGTHAHCNWEPNRKTTLEESAALEALKEVAPAIYLLSDTRTISYDNIETDAYDEGYASYELLVQQRELEAQSAKEATPDQLVKLLLLRSVRRVFSNFRRMALFASSRGEQDSNSIYTRIITSIATSPSRRIARKNQIPQLFDKLLELERNYERVSKYGLTPPFPTRDLIYAIRSLSEDRLAIAIDILEPFIEGSEAKLAAVHDVFHKIDTFVSTINSFLVDKEIKFSLSDGLVITAGNERLDLAQLSSGERHLLLLFCNAISTQTHQSIVMIDEPEISLNIKWQRKLLPALRECTKSERIQYIFATHSMELLSQEVDNVVRLVPERIWRQ